jgi:hypothetical protein
MVDSDPQGLDAGQHWELRNSGNGHERPNWRQAELAPALEAQGCLHALTDAKAHSDILIWRELDSTARNGPQRETVMASYGRLLSVKGERGAMDSSRSVRPDITH